MCRIPPCMNIEVKIVSHQAAVATGTNGATPLVLQLLRVAVGGRALADDVGPGAPAVPRHRPHGAIAATAQDPVRDRPVLDRVQVGVGDPQRTQLAVIAAVVRVGQLPPEEREVHRDQQDGDDREPRRRDVVLERDQRRRRLDERFRPQRESARHGPGALAHQN